MLQFLRRVFRTQIHYTPNSNAPPSAPWIVCMTGIFRVSCLPPTPLLTSLAPSLLPALPWPQLACVKCSASEIDGRSWAGSFRKQQLHHTEMHAVFMTRGVSTLDESWSKQRKHSDTPHPRRIGHRLVPWAHVYPLTIWSNASTAPFMEL